MYPNPTFREKLSFWFAHLAGTEFDMFLHGSISAVVCIILALIFGKRRSVIIPLVITIGLGIAEEIRQVVVGRPFTFDDVNDLLVNIVFASFSASLIFLIRRYQRNRDECNSANGRKSSFFSIVKLAWVALIGIVILGLFLVRLAYQYQSIRYNVKIVSDPPGLIRVEGKEPKRARISLRGFPDQVLTILVTWDNGNTTTRVVQINSDTTFVVKT